jgi:hypothetical protein
MTLIIAHRNRRFDEVNYMKRKSDAYSASSKFGDLTSLNA